MHAKNPDAQALVPATGREFVGIGAVCGENASLLFAINSRIAWNASFVVQEGFLNAPRDESVRKTVLKPQ